MRHKFNAVLDEVRARDVFEVVLGLAILWALLSGALLLGGAR